MTNLSNGLASVTMRVRKERLVVLAALALVSMLLWISSSTLSSAQLYNGGPILLPDRQLSVCLYNTTNEIERMPLIVKTLRGCRSSLLDAEVANTFDRLYDVNLRIGGVFIPETFKPKVLGWLGGNQDSYKQVQKQSVTSIFNRWTHENTIYSPIRALRPGANNGADVLAYIHTLTRDTKASGCDFCDPDNMTAGDVWEEHHIHSTHSSTSSNVFKCHKKDSQFRYPQLMWDLLPKASASQLHPHAQVSLTPDRYYGDGEHILLAAQQYLAQTGFDYFSDLVAVHGALGLTVRHKSAVAMAYITPKKEHEIVVISANPDDDLWLLVATVIETFREDMSIYAWSMAMFLPELGLEITKQTKHRMPAIVRIVDRGSPTSKRSDISAMELFAASNVNADPFKFIAELRAGVVTRLQNAM
eukprot:CFRG2662T1